MEQPIGEETYTIAHENDILVLSSDFLFTDRGTKVPLTATLRITGGYVPKRFVIKGNTSRNTDIDAQVDFTPTSAHIRQGSETRDVTLPSAAYFAISGYSPVAVQMALMRYWLAHGKPAHLAIFPSGDLQIQDRGAETVSVNSRTVQLERYNVRGLIWGMETLWMDSNNNLAALVSTDAEFDHFEAVHDEYEPALPKFVASAARDQMEELTELSRNLPGRRTGTFAFVHATLIDGTGRSPMPDTTIVTSNGRIVSVGQHLEPPKGAQVIDVTGKFIIPGLWDMHAHYEQVEWGPIYLAAGVTTVRDVGNEFEFIKAVRDAVNSGNALGPHMLLAGRRASVGHSLSRRRLPADEDLQLREGRQPEGRLRGRAPGGHVRHRPHSERTQRLRGCRRRYGPDQPHLLHRPALPAQGLHRQRRDRRTKAEDVRCHRCEFGSEPTDHRVFQTARHCPRSYSSGV